MQIIVISHLQYGCSFLGMPIWSRQFFLHHQSKLKPLDSYCNYSKRTIQFKHVPLRSNIRVWIQFSFLSNRCQLQLQSPVGTPIYPTFEERKDEYLCFRKYLCENEWNVVHQISNLGDLLFRKSNITPPSHPMGDTLFQNKKKKDRRAVLFANYLIVQY